MVLNIYSMKHDQQKKIVQVSDRFFVDSYQIFEISLGTNLFRDRINCQLNVNSKNFVRPKLIYYFAVHQVTRTVDNMPVLYADVHTQARLQHYRSVPVQPNELSEYVRDTQILSIINSLNHSISSIL